MLDPSLLLERSSFERTVEQLSAFGTDDGFQFFVLESLQRISDDPNASNILRNFFEIRGDLVPADEVRSRLGQVGVISWERPASAVEEFADFYGALGEETGELLQDILFDEWFFVTHESWLVARVKATFHSLVHAGELGVEILNPLVRKTLKKDSSYVVRTADRLRHLASGSL